MYTEFAKASMGKRINILFRLSMMNFRNEMKKLGFGAGDYPFIALVFLNEGLSQDELSRQMRVDKSYTARALAKLEKSGMIERQTDEKEHRIKRVFIGPEARRIEREFFDILETWNTALISDIDPEQIETVRRVMDQMIVNAETFLGLEGNPN